MIIYKHGYKLVSHLKKLKASKTQVAFVPTMGALHKGHISLITKSKEVQDSICVCSIFVNPTQFNDADDFKKYPVTLEQDIYQLEKSGCDILFLPDVKEVYNDGAGIQSRFEIGYLENILEGKHRPGHFQGVCQVVKRLLEIIQPTHLFLGQKDYQQCMVIKKLLQVMKAEIQIVMCPTLREENGLAMSSRNLRLTDEQKEIASEIYETLLYLKKNLGVQPLKKIKSTAVKNLQQKHFKVDYVEIADAETLQVLDSWNSSEKIIALIAAYIGDVRLIDNMMLN